MNFAFISRHEPTPEQYMLAELQGVKLIHVGDMDAFTVTPNQVLEKAMGIDGVIVVHPAAACRLRQAFHIGIFENGMRSEEGGKPTFFAKNFHIYPKD